MCAHLFGNYLFFLFYEKKRIIAFKRQRLPPDVFCQTPGIPKWYFTFPIPPPHSGQTNSIHRICMDVAHSRFIARLSPLKVIFS